MSHFDNDDGLDAQDDPADWWDLADRAHDAGAGK